MSWTSLEPKIIVRKKKSPRNLQRPKKENKLNDYYKEKMKKKKNTHQYISEYSHIDL